MTTPPRPTAKRLIVCCDGTWMNSDDGYNKPSWWESWWGKQGHLQVPSNVTRISRCFKRRCDDGKLQIISYESGVGTGSNTLDSITGGAFGLGLSERVREAYSYICANYMDGDEIILIGFSRGAFTARSVAGMVSSIGLLTRKGVENFYSIFNDVQHWQDEDWKDPFPDYPFTEPKHKPKPKGPGAAATYRAWLIDEGLARDRQKDGSLITVKAVGVWDTVGSLGVPTVGWLEKWGVRPWHDTTLSDRIEYAFQALALDEDRTPFSPAVWERFGDDEQKTDLRQVWFPGNHGNIGGGWPDQGVANSSLAWMMDQLASVGVEFDLESLTRIYEQSKEYYDFEQAKLTPRQQKAAKPWAREPIYSNNKPERPWGLWQIYKTGGFFNWAGGATTRTPGLYRAVEGGVTTSRDKPPRFLEDTHERIHSSVRVRLRSHGLGVDDVGVWTNPALSQWQLARSKAEYPDPLPSRPSWDPQPSTAPKAGGAARWVWEFTGKAADANPDPRRRVMVEEPLGPFERYLLNKFPGKPNVYDFAETAN